MPKPLNTLIRVLKTRGIFGLFRALGHGIRRRIWDNKTVMTWRLKKYMRLHNRCYSKISRLAPSLNDGVHPKHRIMHYQQFFVDHVSESDSVLDVGCGTGHVAHAVAHKAQHVTGIDFDEKHLATCVRDYAKDNITYVAGDATTYPFDRQFDAIILSNVLEHITDRVKLLQDLGNLSDTLLLRVPMITRDWLVPYKKEMGIEYRLDITHETEFTLEQAQQEVAAAGWTIEKHRVIWGEFWAVLKKPTP